MLPIVINLLAAILVIVSLLIILLVLMQRPKNEGLGAAFGGGMTENLFGAQTTNVLQTATRYLGGLFFALSLLLSWLYVKKTTISSTLQQRLSAPTAIPAATPAPDDKAPAVNGAEAVSDPVKAAPATPVPAADGTVPPPATPPATPEPAKPAPAVEGAAPTPGTPAAPDAAKPAPAPAEKPADKPAEVPAVPDKPAN